MRKVSVREKLGALRAKFRMGEEISESDIEAIREKEHPSENEGERKLWLTLLLLSRSQDNTEEIDATISSLMEMMEKKEDEMIYRGKARRIIISFTPYSSMSFLKKVVLYLDSMSLFLCSGPLAFPVSSSVEKRDEIWNTLTSVFSGCSEYSVEEDEEWSVQILDDGERYFYFGGRRDHPFPLFPSFSFQSLAEELSLPERNGKDYFTFLSFQYSRLREDGKGERLESIVIDGEKSEVTISVSGSEETMDYSRKNAGSLISKILPFLDVYGFHPPLSDHSVPSGEPPYGEFLYTKFFFSASTKYGRTLNSQGYFARDYLPSGWDKAARLLWHHIPQTRGMEATEESLIAMGTTNKDTVYVAGVVFIDSEYEKEYSYISPFGLIRPGKEVMVPVGENNKPRKAKVRSAYAFDKEPEMSYRKLKSVISVLE